MGATISVLNGPMIALAGGSFAIAFAAWKAYSEAGVEMEQERIFSNGLQTSLDDLFTSIDERIKKEL